MNRYEADEILTTMYRDLECAPTRGDRAAARMRARDAVQALALDPDVEREIMADIDASTYAEN